MSASYGKIQSTSHADFDTKAGMSTPPIDPVSNGHCSRVDKAMNGNRSTDSRVKGYCQTLCFTKSYKNKHFWNSLDLPSVILSLTDRMA